MSPITRVGQEYCDVTGIFEGACYRIVWDREGREAANTYHTDTARRDFQRLCNNCGLLEEEHANGGKCLYGPGSWE